LDNASAQQKPVIAIGIAPSSIPRGYPILYLVRKLVAYGELLIGLGLISVRSPSRLRGGFANWDFMWRVRHQQSMALLASGPVMLA
jgi:hypothetical protein